jgi:hypothetical protein
MMLKRIIYLSFLCQCSLILLSCSEDPVARPNAYLVIETQIPNVDINGATFSAKVDNFGKSSAISHGFLWGKNHKPDFSEFIINSAFSNVLLPIEGELKNPFSARANTDLKPGDIYHVRNYVITEKDTIMGNIVEFESLGSSRPFIYSVIPNYGSQGDIITVTGENFALNKRIIQVRFNNNYAQVLAELGEPNELMFKIPTTPFNGKVQLILEI